MTDPNEGAPDPMAGSNGAKSGVPVDLGSAADVRPEPPKPKFVQKGKVKFKQDLKEAVSFRELKESPYRLRPLIIMTIVSAVVALDGQIFGLARPEIIRDLKLDILPVFQAFSFISFFLIFATLGLSYWMDKARRTYFLAGGAILSGVAALFTARATTLWQLGVSRAADSIGSTALVVPTFSLYSDYYPPDKRGKVFAFDGMFARLIGLSAPVIVAYLATATSLSWRLPYLITGPLLIILGIFVLLTLKEPVRGYMERRSLGASEDVAMKEEERPSFGEAWRTIWSIRTMRRLFIADIPGSAGDFTFSFFISLFLLEYYGLGIKERAFMSAGIVLVALPFAFMAGGVVDVLMRRRPQRVLIFSGMISLAASFFMLVIALKPPFWGLVAIYVLFGCVSALIGPAKGVLFAQILPAHVRTLGGNVRILAQLPGTILRTIIVGQVLQTYGIQGGLMAAVPFVFISALLELSAAGFFERDMRSAFAANMASEEYRRAKELGRGKLLVCRDVDVEYDGVQVLFGVDFDVEEGQIIALLGTNGAGKSTLLRAISGTQEASSGAIVFDGRDITHMPPHEIAARHVIHMPGGKGVFPGLTVKENLLLGNWMAEETEGKQRLEEVFEIFPILRERQNENANLLSGGEQQMLSLAQAFLGEPKLLMIDELSLGLSPAVVQQLIEIVREIHRRGTTIIIVEQSVNVALTVADRAIFMEKGEVRFFGETKDLLSRPDILRAVYVKGAGALTEGAPATAMKTERELRRYELEQARPVLEVKGLTKSFGGIQAVRGVDFSLKEGESLGLIGPNGAGKTTIFELISGYQIPDEGQVLLEGEDVTRLRPDIRAKKRMIRRFQDARMFPSLTVYENILVALEQKLEVRSMVFTALQVPQVRQAERRIRLRADKLIELLDLGAFRDKFAKELSTGLRRIADLACVLAAEPRVLLLDEPSSGIAQAESEGLAPLLRRVRFETGCSMLIIEHDIPLISAVSDELIALDQGAVVVRGTPEEVLNDERVIQSYLGTSEEVIKRSGVLT